MAQSANDLPLRQCASLDASLSFDAWNDNPKPFLWTATVDSIVDKLARCRQTLEQIQPGCTRPKAKRRKKRLSS